MSVRDTIDDFCAALQCRHLEGSLATARRTALVMRQLVTSQRHTTPQALLDEVRSTGRKIQSARPLELAIGNIVRRVLHIIREESLEEDEEKKEDDKTVASERSRVTGLLSRAFRGPTGRAVSLHNLLDNGVLNSLPYKQDEQNIAAPSQSSGGEATDTGKAKKGRTAVWGKKHAVIDQINELIEELDEIDNNVAAQALDYIHANEVILTFGKSNTTLLFLCEAKKKREFQVIVAEGAPSFQGQSMSRQLGQAGIQTTAITDSAIFAMMARANKVLVGTHALLANGGIIAPVGTHMVALAAKKHSVPFVVLVGLHKLSAIFPHDPSVTLIEFKSPAEVLDYSTLTGTVGSQDAETHLEVPNPAFDYVPPELISLFVTDTGGYTPSYVYRLLAEFYTREDFALV